MAKASQHGEEDSRGKERPRKGEIVFRTAKHELAGTQANPWSGTQEFGALREACIALCLRVRIVPRIDRHNEPAEEKGRRYVAPQVRYL